MNLFENTVKLRGYLNSDPEVPAPDVSVDNSYTLLMLSIESGKSDTATGAFTGRTAQSRTICPGPDFCGVSADMTKGDHVEVEGEIYVYDPDRPVLAEEERCTAKQHVCEVCARQLRRLDASTIVSNEDR